MTAGPSIDLSGLVPPTTVPNDPMAGRHVIGLVIGPCVGNYAAGSSEVRECRSAVVRSEVHDAGRPVG